MADRLSPEKRSALMGRVRSSGNVRNELRLIAIMRAHGITGWRRNQRLIGKPDFVFRRERVVVFVDGCFWQGCPTCCRVPSSNQHYWRPKVESNRARARSVGRQLRQKGWRVVRIWQHELRDETGTARRLLRGLAASVGAGTSGR